MYIIFILFPYPQILKSNILSRVHGGLGGGSRLRHSARTKNMLMVNGFVQRDQYNMVVPELLVSLIYTQELITSMTPVSVRLGTS